MAADASRRAAREDSVTWAVRVLRDHGMPPAEVHSILAADDAETIRRHMELHRERLEERLVDQRSMAGVIEALLIEATGRRRAEDGRHSAHTRAGGYTR
jgi:DNA-binding transcriptional MerR regulator